MSTDTILSLRDTKAALAAEGKRGSKVRQHRSTIAFDAIGRAELVTELTLINVRGRELKTIEHREPATITGATHVMNGSTIACRNCLSETFFDLGRSLHYENLECTECGVQCSPLTETGASF